MNSHRGAVRPGGKFASRARLGLGAVVLACLGACGESSHEALSEAGTPERDAADPSTRDASTDGGTGGDNDVSVGDPVDASISDARPTDAPMSEAGGQDGRADGVDSAVRDAIDVDTRGPDRESGAPDVPALPDAPLPPNDGAVDAPPSTCPATFPDETSGVMLQGFYWDAAAPAGSSWWKVLQSRACDLRKSGITAVWIPPPTKAQSTADNGYGVFDHYDLGEFDQRGSIATHWGTRSDLEAMIAAMHGAGIRVYADVVMNHMMGGTNETFNSNVTAPTNFDMSARLKVDPSHGYVWDHTKFSGCQTCSSASNCSFTTWNSPTWDFDSTISSDPMSSTYATLGMVDALNGCEIRYTVDSNQTELVAWGNWLTTTLKLDGYRLDTGKHMLPAFVNRWFSEVKGTSRFAVTEFYDGNPDHLAQVIDLFKKQTWLFDFPTHFQWQRLSAANGSFDMRSLRPGSTDNGQQFLNQHGDFAVTFVDNHDTDRNANTRVANFKLLAYAYILTRSVGYPAIFYKDYFDAGLGGSIDKIIAARDAHGFGAAYESDESDANFYVSGRAGDTSHKGMLVFLNDGGDTTKTLTSSPFANKMMKEETGASTQTVTTDAKGGGAFPVPSRGHAIWAPAN